MTEPGSDGSLNVMFFKNFQIICLMTLLTKGEEGHRNCLGDDFNDLVSVSNLLSGALLVILHGIY